MLRVRKESEVGLYSEVKHLGFVVPNVKTVTKPDFWLREIDVILTHALVGVTVRSYE
jgi:hypothetical protein